MSSDGVNAYFGVNNNGVFKNVFTIDVNGNINFNSVGNVLQNESAKLQIDSTTQGFLPPRMTTAQRNAIVSPTAGLIVYDITENKHYGFNGTTWNALY